MSKVSARWVPRNLNVQDRFQRLQSSRELLGVYEENPENFHARFVTGDETWIHHWDPETKQDQCNGSTLAHPHQRSSKPNLQLAKVMATVFWDSKGVLMVDYKPAGICITGAYYADLMKQLRTANKEKRRES